MAEHCLQADLKLRCMCVRAMYTVCTG